MTLSKGTKNKSVEFVGKGITSRQDIRIEVIPEEPGHGIVFELPNPEGGAWIKIPAQAKYVVNTLRNVVLGSEGARLCIVEHFLAAASLFGLDDLTVKVDGPEMPLGDGSAKIWTDLFVKAGWERATKQAQFTLKETVLCRKGDRMLLAIPDETFSVTYMMDWNHPSIGKMWQMWTPAQQAFDISDARTFGSLKEHQLLGIADEVVSLTPEGFNQPLHWPDEPVRHKLLDLVGDLALAGVNPMRWKARFISIKAGHELDVEMASQLAALI